MLLLMRLRVLGLKSSRVFCDVEMTWLAVLDGEYGWSICLDLHVATHSAPERESENFDMN